jgi:hypothetical protein
MTREVSTKPKLHALFRRSSSERETNQLRGEREKRLNGMLEFSCDAAAEIAFHARAFAEAVREELRARHDDNFDGAVHDLSAEIAEEPVYPGIEFDVVVRNVFFMEADPDTRTDMDFSVDLVARGAAKETVKLTARRIFLRARALDLDARPVCIGYIDDDKITEGISAEVDRA